LIFIRESKDIRSGIGGERQDFEGKKIARYFLFFNDMDERDGAVETKGESIRLGQYLHDIYILLVRRWSPQYRRPSSLKTTN
jgi:hypothetical protein